MTNKTTRHLNTCGICPHIPPTRCWFILADCFWKQPTGCQWTGGRQNKLTKDKRNWRLNDKKPCVTFFSVMQTGARHGRVPAITCHSTSACVTQKLVKKIYSQYFQSCGERFFGRLSLCVLTSVSVGRKWLPRWSRWRNEQSLLCVLFLWHLLEFDIAQTRLSGFFQTFVTSRETARAGVWSGLPCNSEPVP